MATKIEPPAGLKCRSNEVNGSVCEFYGSVVWSGYCSKCYKIYVTATIGNSNSSVNSREMTRSGNTAIGALKKPPELIRDVGEKIQQPAHKIKEIAQTQAEQLKLRLRSLKFGNQGAKLYKECDQLIEQCHKSQFTLEDLQKTVQMFYRNLDNLLTNSQAEESDQQEVIQSFEDYLATRLHGYFFSKFPQLEEADKFIQKRMSNLYWVTAEQLESPLTPQTIARDAEGVGTPLDKAMASLMLIHSKKTPREKLMSIDEACSELNVALQKALTRPVSADDFLPSFVWIMLTSKPPQLESNAAFIDSLAHPQNVTQGQSAYNFNTFQVALHYISKEMNSVSLKVPEEDFEKLMRGEVTRKIMFNDMHQSLEVKQAQLDVLQTRNEQLMEDVKKLTSSISSFRTTMKQTCDDVLNSVDKKSILDSSDTNKETLSRLIGDFDYFAKPSIDDILDPFGPSSQNLASPLVPISLSVSDVRSATHMNNNNDLFGEDLFLGGFDTLSVPMSGSNDHQPFASLPAMPSNTNSEDLLN